MAARRFADVTPPLGQDPHDPDGIRLQKVLSQAGIASRRHGEILISQGRVEVDGSIVTSVGTRVSPGAVIKVDGQRIATKADGRTYAFNKPVGVLSAMSDADERPNLGDYTRKLRGPIYHVGRLDIQTEGLILLTGNGELAHRLAHPSFEISKTYLAQLDGKITRGIGAQMMEGIELEDGPIALDRFVLKQHFQGQSLVEVTLHSGRNRIVRRLFEHFEFPVRRLVRLSVGPIHLDNLKPGEMREIGGPDLAELLAATGL